MKIANFTINNTNHFGKSTCKTKIRLLERNRISMKWKYRGLGLIEPATTTRNVFQVIQYPIGLFLFDGAIFESQVDSIR